MMKKLLAMFAASAIVLSTFMGCNLFKKSLPTPENIVCIGNLVKWDKVAGASGYTVIHGGVEINTTENYYYLADSISGTTQVSVYAVDSTETYKNSGVAYCSVSSVPLIPESLDVTQLNNYKVNDVLYVQGKTELVLDYSKLEYAGNSHQILEIIKLPNVINKIKIIGKKGINYLNISIRFEERSAPAFVELIDFSFHAYQNTVAIEVVGADSTLVLSVKGEITVEAKDYFETPSQVSDSGQTGRTGSNGRPALIASKIVIAGGLSFSAIGGNGGSGGKGTNAALLKFPGNGGAGGAGGPAVQASTLYVLKKEFISFNLIGGKGGEAGEAGNDGFPSGNPKAGSNGRNGATCSGSIVELN